MGKILAFDYGARRVGLAQSDPEAHIAFPLCVLPPEEVLDYVKAMVDTEEVSAFVVGLPCTLARQATDATKGARQLAAKLRAHFPQMPLYWIDERLTSRIAEDTLVRLYPKGKNKRRRIRQRGLDASTAALILQSHLAQSKA